MKQTSFVSWCWNLTKNQSYFVYDSNTQPYGGERANDQCATTKTSCCSSIDSINTVMEHISIMRWTAIPATSVSYSVIKVNIFVSTEWTISLVDLPRGHPRPLFHLFSSFQTNITIFTTNICEKMSWPSSIRHWDSNPRPSEHEFPPITTRPGREPLVN